MSYFNVGFNRARTVDDLMQMLRRVLREGCAYHPKRADGPCFDCIEEALERAKQIGLLGATWRES